MWICESSFVYSIRYHLIQISKSISTFSKLLIWVICIFVTKLFDQRENVFVTSKINVSFYFRLLSRPSSSLSREYFCFCYSIQKYYYQQFNGCMLLNNIVFRTYIFSLVWLLLCLQKSSSEIVRSDIGGNDIFW